MKIAVGCLIQWYEVDIIEQYFYSLRQAIKDVKDYNPNTIVTVYNELDLSTYIERSKEYNDIPNYVDRIREYASKYGFSIAKIHSNIYPYSISEFRHDFNSNFCRAFDLLVWGESDMLMPRRYLTYLSQLSDHVPDSKWIATFASCKMWDDSWQALEHPKFSVMSHSDSKDDWWSLNYTMTYEEMEAINEEIEQPTVVEIRSKTGELKFNGCGLALTSDVIKAGINVPLAAFFVHEDTAFMKLINVALPTLKQFHFSDVLLVHNRKHPLKRYLVSNEQGNTVGTRRNSNPVYVSANKLSQENVANLLNTSIKFHTWKQTE